MKKELKFKKKKINEILINKDSKRIPVSKLERQKRKGKYPYYGAAGIIDYVNDWIFEGKHLLIAEDGSVLTKQNKPVLQLVDGKFWVNNHAHVLTCKDENDLNYIFYALKNINISSLITGSVQLKLNQDNLNKIEGLILQFQMLTNLLGQL